MSITFPVQGGAGPSIQKKLPNWEGLDSLRLSRFWSSGAPGRLLGMGNE